MYFNFRYQAKYPHMLFPVSQHKLFARLLALCRRGIIDALKPKKEIVIKDASGSQNLGVFTISGSAKYY